MQSSRHLFDEMRYFILSREIHQELLLQAEKSVKKEIVKPKLSAVRDGQQKENKKNKNWIFVQKHFSSFPGTKRSIE